MPALPHKFQSIVDIRHRFGLVKTLQWLTGRAAKKLLRLEVSEMVCMEVDRLPSIGAIPEFNFRFLSVEEINRLTADPTYELAPEFASRAAGGQDFCFAALHGDEQVAHFGWYALGSIEGRHHVGVPMTFPPDAAYMYNAFTLPAYRGRRLFPAAVALAMQSLAGRRITKLISTIECINFASLRSFRDLGCETLGQLWTIGRGSNRWNWAPKAARSRGIQFGKETREQLTMNPVQRVGT